MNRLILIALLGVLCIGRSISAQDPVDGVTLWPGQRETGPWILPQPPDDVHRLPPVGPPQAIAAPERPAPAGDAEGGAPSTNEKRAGADGKTEQGLSLRPDRQMSLYDRRPLSLGDDRGLSLKGRRYPTSSPPLWQGSFELGLNGSEGNSTTFNFRFGFDAKRKTKTNLLRLDLDYNKKTTESEETANRLYFDGRDEWMLSDTPWTWFIHETTEYDEFKAYDVRVTGDSGLGYRFIDTDTTWLIARTGAGVSHEIGGPERHAVPELTFGADYEHLISRRQKIMASVEYVPELTDFNDFRFTSKAVWEAVLDDQMNLSMRIGVLDRYDSTPHGKKPNDVDYSVTVLWNF